MYQAQRMQIHTEHHTGCLCLLHHHWEGASSLRVVVKKQVNPLLNSGLPVASDQYPVLTKAYYENRFQRARDAMGDLDCLVIYADREHFSNVEYFTGFDPRFEEALLIVPKQGEASLLVGKEGWDYAKAIKPQVRVVMYAPFSLPEQPRGSVRRLADHLKEAGVRADSRIGLVGWKYFTPEDGLNPGDTFDVPHFIVRELQQAAPAGHIRNATALMVSNDGGLRITLEDQDLLFSELAGTLVSRNVHRVLDSLREGVTELDASQAFQINGLPLSIHCNLNFGQQLDYAIASPTPHKRLEQGEVVAVGMAYRYALCHKVGYFIKDENEAPPGLDSFYSAYFRAIAAWYEAVRIGATGGSVYESVRQVTGELTEFGINLNPGHLIHSDEWSNTPFYEGNRDVLRSGMMIQCDFSANHPQSGFSAHAEDGILLADAETRARLAAASPIAWQRIQARRAFMTEVLNIRLNEEILPTSDMPGMVFPYLGNLNTVLAFEN